MSGTDHDLHAGITDSHDRAEGHADEHVEDAEDAEFVRLGRAAGAELRQPAPSDGAAGIRSAARRRTAIAATVGVLAVIGVTVGGIVIVAGDDESGDPTPVTVPVTLPPTTGTPVLYRAHDGRRSVLMIDRGDGSAPTPLVGELDGLDQLHADWSPDGSRIAFVMTARDGTVDLWTVGADGTGPELLVDCDGECRWLEHPAWSPDGTTLAVSKLAGTFGDPAVGTLELVDADDGSSETLLTAEPTDFFAGVSWSPSGRQLAVEVAHRTDTGPFSEPVAVHVAIVDATASPPTIRGITDPSSFAWLPDWSPDGSTIVFEAPAEPGATAPDLFTMEPDGTGRRQVTNLTSSGGAAYEPTYSSDGSRILFSARLGPDSELVLASVAVDGSDLRPARGDTYVVGAGPRQRPVP